LVIFRVTLAAKDFELARSPRALWWRRRLQAQILD
jgi:hypothetical protein